MVVLRFLVRVGAMKAFHVLPMNEPNAGAVALDHGASDRDKETFDVIPSDGAGHWVCENGLKGASLPIAQT